MTRLRVGPLVRAISCDSAVIWTEWTDACSVTVRVSTDGYLSASFQSQTVRVGERYYAAVQLSGLRLATWYSYRVSSSEEESESLAIFGGEARIQCFRTLDLPEAGNTLQLAYGSCRKLSVTEPDALSALGPWLISQYEQRETAWPRLLLLVGDQIYSNDRVGRHKQVHSPSQAGRPKVSENVVAQSFAEFARLYEESWTADDGIRQVLAVLPTYMIFDDHEITNSWNISPTWRSRALESGLEQTMVDGLVAYWIYQGWGNLRHESTSDALLLSIMQEAMESGRDALEDLRACIRRSVYGEIALRWYYDIPTAPPIFVADARADRPSLLDKAGGVDTPARIMGREQMTELREWMQQHSSTIVLLVSSVPVLLPPIIGLAEYVMGVRPLQWVPLRWIGRSLGRAQQSIASRIRFEHWPVFSATWRELVNMLATRSRDIIVLSGDVHFSYAAEARCLFPRSRRPTLYQLVASPFRNKLGCLDKRLILGQAWIKRILFGGLYMHVLPLMRAGSNSRVPFDLLMRNTVAFVELRPEQEEGQGAGRYGIRQVYLGVRDGKLEEIAKISMR